MQGHGLALVEAGRYEESIGQHLRTLAFLEEAGDRIEPHIAHLVRADLEMSIGRAHIFLKNWPKATNHLHTALQLCRTSGTQPWKAAPWCTSATPCWPPATTTRPGMLSPSALPWARQPIPAASSRPENASPN
ncbi:hypothetical protein [Streptomyces sp. NPDC048106]|uniref:hypothetical protein n=1 Tax=Streptomyces sp. NPDC048106 TaxID=3155750 RepID=UPI003451932A